MKGAAMLELIIVVVMVCIFFMATIIVNGMWNDVTEDDPIFTEHASVAQHTENVFSLFGFFAIFLFGGSIVAMIISSLFMESHPIFLAISVITFIVSIPLVAMLSNATMETVTSNSAWETLASANTAGTQMIGNLVLFAVVGGLFIMVALYAKFSSR